MLFSQPTHYSFQLSAPFLLGLGAFIMRIFRLFDCFCIDSMAMPSSLSLLFFVGWFVYVVLFFSWPPPLVYSRILFCFNEGFFSFLPIKKNHLKHLLTPFSRNAIKFYQLKTIQNPTDSKGSQFQMKGSLKSNFLCHFRYPNSLGTAGNKINNS